MLVTLDDVYKNPVDPVRVINMTRFHNLGDALGAPYEFTGNPKVIKTNDLNDKPMEVTIGTFNGKLDKEVMIKTRFRGDKIFPPGSTTDDTNMTLALFYYLSNSVFLRYDPVEATKAYMESINRYGGIIGINTRRLLKYKNYETYSRKYQEAFPIEQPNTWSQSNGSLMRCSPLAMTNQIEYFIQDAKITNPHPVNLLCSFIYGVILQMAVRSYHVEEIRQVIVNVFQIYKNFTLDPFQISVVGVLKKSGITQLPRIVFEAYLDAMYNRHRDIKTNRGHVVHALYFVLKYLFHNDNKDYLTIMGEIITLGGDTDTNAAITGAMLGALYNQELESGLRLKIELISIVNSIDYFGMFDNITRMLNVP